MAANVYFLASNLSDASNSMSVLADIVWVRSADAEWVQIKDYWQNNATGEIVFVDPVDPVNYTEFLATGTINDAGTFPFSTTTIAEMRTLEGQVQASFNDRNVELREATAVITFPAV